MYGQILKELLYVQVLIIIHSLQVSWTEFFIRFFIFPSLNSVKFAVVGMIFVVIGQAVRSLAMITCGESFNHIIQNFKKKNHVLVTSGM